MATKRKSTSTFNSELAKAKVADLEKRLKQTQEDLAKQAMENGKNHLVEMEKHSLQRREELANLDSGGQDCGSTHMPVPHRHRNLQA